MDRSKWSQRLAKYEAEYLQAKEAEAMARDPVAVLKAQNEALVSERMRLEAETENLAREMVLQKVGGRMGAAWGPHGGRMGAA